jgi:diguanylate cyclase (GGDEF)-like protein
MKPLAISDFLLQIEKAVAVRLFHLKSIQLMQQSDNLTPEVKGHLSDVTSIYFFLRKLMLSLEISEIMRITLEELNQKTGAIMTLISVNILGYTDVFAMPSKGEIDQNYFWNLLGDLGLNERLRFDQQKFDNREIPFIAFKGKLGEMPLVDLYPVSVPMMVTDRNIGTLVVFFDDPLKSEIDQNQFLYVFASIVSSIIEHGYSALQARQQAKTDSLTGIANHRMFHQTLEREISRANRKKGTFSLVLIDIDNFKRVNDTYGHQIGDAVIIDLTRRVAGIIRTGDILARYGGEEFGIILPDTEFFGAETLASRIILAVNSMPLVYSQFTIDYTVSIGFMVYDGNLPVKKDQLIEAADSALYSSKRNGKNMFSIGTLKE